MNALQKHIEIEYLKSLTYTEINDIFHELKDKINELEKLKESEVSEEEIRLIAVINTDEQPIEAIQRELGDCIDNEDCESYMLNGEEYCYHPVEIKQMPIDEVTIYEINKIE